MWGYFDRKTPSQGTLDPLYARVLVLEAGDVRVALVALDLGRTFGPSEIVQLRERAKSSSNTSYVLVAASHTHAGPVIMDEYAPGQTPAWETADLEKISTAIQEAASHLVPARIGTGYGEKTIGYNRRRALMCGALRRVYTERALRTELAARIGWRPIVNEPELRRLGGMRPTTLEERLTRADRRSIRLGRPPLLVNL